MIKSLFENDHLLSYERIIERPVQKQLLLRDSLNPGFYLDNEEIKTWFKQPYQKKAINTIEQAFLLWYVSILGDEWKIVADIMNYHPFTKGGIRDAEEMKNYFYHLNQKMSIYYHLKTNIDPWRSSGLPILINQRPPSLLNSVHQQCLIHQRNLKVIREALT